MAAKLKNLKITKVDFVDEGANPDADINLRKRKEGKDEPPAEPEEKNLFSRMAEEFAKNLANALSFMPPSIYQRAVEEPAAEPKGEETNMKIDKSKMTPEEREILEGFEKRYGAEENGGVELPDAPANTPSGTPGAEEEDVYKGLNPKVKAELEALKKFREEAEDAALRQIAKGYEIVGQKADDLFPILKSLKASSSAAYEQVITVLDSAKTAIEKSGVFGETGRTGSGSTAMGGAVKEAETKAAELMKSKTGLSKAQAIDEVLSADPDLAKRYEEED